MKIAIIGAGTCGIISLKYAIDNGHSCDLFEQTGSVGGTFVYTDAIDFDENGFPVHTVMYQDLVLNLPKEVMAFSDFPFPEEENSFIGQPAVLNYYESFVERFNLKQHMKFYNCVKNVELTEGTKWAVEVLNLKTKSQVTSIYDAVFVCNGHYNSPITPEIPGQDIFEGLQFHCYKYRSPKLFKDKTVLVVGTGPSGPDISLHLSPVAKHIFLSVSEKYFSEKADNITDKPRVVRLCSNKAIFTDGTEEFIDAILYCTGYKHSIPFLGDSCDVTVAQRQVFPLFKHMVNIEHPTMIFIGLFSSWQLTTPVWDLQARYALALLEKKFTLPSKEVMLKDFETENLWRQENNLHPHFLVTADAQRTYFKYLSDTAKIQNLPLVLTKIFECHMKNEGNKRIAYKILDNENFEHHTMEENSKI